MANYPDWVLAHKKKGTYINKVGDRYYLYAAHSERVPGTKKVRRVCDGYLGRITQDQGLIPPRDRPGTVFCSVEYGLSSLILSLCGNIHSGFRRTFVVNGEDGQTTMDKQAFQNMSLINKLVLSLCKLAQPLMKDSIRTIRLRFSWNLEDNLAILLNVFDTDTIKKCLESAIPAGR